MIGAAGDREMPFGIGALNVLWMLRCHLMLFRDVPSFCPCCGAGIRDEYSKKQPHGGRHIRGFAMLLLDEPDAFFHVFALTLLVTAAVWRRRGDGSPPLGRGSRVPSIAGGSGGGGRGHSSGSGSASLISHPSRPPLDSDAAVSAAVLLKEAGGAHEHLPPSSVQVVPASLPREMRANSQTASLGTASILGGSGGGAAASAGSSGRSGSLALSHQHAGFASSATSTISGGVSVGGRTAAATDAPAVADLRFLQFKGIVAEAREMLLEALATFPPDLTTLRATLFKRLRSSRPTTGGAGSSSSPSAPSAAVARGYGKPPPSHNSDGGDFSYEPAPQRRGGPPRGGGGGGGSAPRHHPAQGHQYRGGAAPVPVPSSSAYAAAAASADRVGHHALPVHGSSYGVGLTSTVAMRGGGASAHGQQPLQGPGQYYQQQGQGGSSAYASTSGGAGSALDPWGPTGATHLRAAAAAVSPGDVSEEIMLHQDAAAVEGEAALRV